MNNRQFYNRISAEVRRCLDEAERMRQHMLHLEEQSRDNKYSAEYKQIFAEQARQERRNIERIIENGKKACQAICDEYTAELRDADALRGADVNDDMKLLQGGVKLSRNDVQSMLNRNSSNRTMTQLILRYAEDNGIETGVQYVGNKPKIDKVNSAMSAVDVALKWWHDPSTMMFDKLIGKGSALHGAFAIEHDTPEEAAPVTFSQEQVDVIMNGLHLDQA